MNQPPRNTLVVDYIRNTEIFEVREIISKYTKHYHFKDNKCIIPNQGNNEHLGKELLDREFVVQIF